MATQEDLRSIFEFEMAAEGGVADPLDFPEPLRPTLTDMLAEFRSILASTANAPAPSYIAHNVYVDIVDNPTLNAVAFESSGHEFIGVNAGSLLFLYDAFLSLFSHPGFMSDVGEANKERTTDDDLRTWLQRKNVNHLHELAPLDPARAKAAQFLTINAYNFIFAHEVGHLTKGHLKYLEKAYGIFKYFAYEDKSATAFAAPLRHVLEIGADENAAHGSLHMFKPRKYGKVLPDAGGLLCDFRSWAVSVGVVFALFDRHVELHKAGSVSSHPTPDVRFLNVIWSAWEEIKKVVPDAFEAGTSQTLRASSELNNFFTTIKMDTRPFLLVVPNEPGKTVRRELFEQVSALRNRLLEIENEQMADLAAKRSDVLRQNLFTQGSS